MNMDHLKALQVRLSNTKSRLAYTNTPSSRAYYAQQVAMCEKEIAGEYKFLGIDPPALEEVSDDELLEELSN